MLRFSSINDCARCIAILEKVHSYAAAVVRVVREADIYKLVLQRDRSSPVVHM